uniref:Ribonuclease P protein subunit p29 n=1 Tax=Timema douglasi TaxID=61478 RepID=A0A7R8VJR1_TIMDO|nr:unnamed protein product [Timema douglasi]
MASNELYQKLPSSVGAQTIGSQSHLKVTDFLKLSLAKKVWTEIGPEFRKTLSLTKYKGKPRKVKPRDRKTYLSRKERKSLGLNKIEKKGLLFRDFLPLHQLWKEYMRSHLDTETLEASGFTGDPGGKQWNQVSQLLIKAEYVGAYMRVVRSRCSSLVGKAGLVLMDTQKTFKLIGKDNVVRVVPKETCTFTVQLDKYVFTVYGKQFCIRSSHRSVRKVKTLLVPDL